MDLVFDNTQGREEIKTILTDYINSNAVPVHISLPVALIYGESGDSMMMSCYHPHNLGESIYDVLRAAKGIHDWHAGVYFHHAAGLALVFFTAKDDVKIPELFLRTSKGTVQ